MKIKKKKLKQIINVLFPIVSLFIVLYIILRFEQLDNIVSAFNSLKPAYVIYGVFVMIISWLIEGYILYDISDKQLSLVNSILIVVAGLFFNAITPFSSGGQPMQLYMMHKYKISVSKGSSILARKFLVFQTIMVFYGLMVVLFEASFFMTKVPTFVYVSILGFTVNVLVILGLYFVCFRYNASRKVFVRIAKKIRKLFKKQQKVRKGCTHFMKGVREFYVQMRYSVHGTNWVTLGVLTFLQLSLFYSIPFVIAMGLNLSRGQFIRMISASAFVSMVTAFIPLPGAAFGAEGGFYVFFKMFFPENLVLFALIIWRLLTFYMPLLVGFFVVLYLKFKGIGVVIKEEESSKIENL